MACADSQVSVGTAWFGATYISCEFSHAIAGHAVWKICNLDPWRALETHTEKADTEPGFDVIAGTA